MQRQSKERIRRTAVGVLVSFTLLLVLGGMGIAQESVSDSVSIMFRVLGVRTLSVDVEGEGSVEVNGDPVTLPYEDEFVENSVVELKAVPGPGSELEKWVVDGTEVESVGGVIEVEMDDDKAAVAHFTQMYVATYASLETRADHSGIEAVLSSNENTYYAELTGPDGRSVFTGVEPGEYTLILNIDRFLKTEVKGVTVDETAIQVGTEDTPVVLLIGDIVGNNTINIFDLIQMTDYWGQEVGPEQSADLNEDGHVNLWDLIILTENWGATTAKDATYEYSNEHPYFGN